VRKMTDISTEDLLDKYKALLTELVGVESQLAKRKVKYWRD